MVTIWTACITGTPRATAFLISPSIKPSASIKDGWGPSLVMITRFVETLPSVIILITSGRSGRSELFRNSVHRPSLKRSRASLAVIASWQELRPAAVREFSLSAEQPAACPSTIFFMFFTYSTVSSKKGSLL